MQILRYGGKPFGTISLSLTKMGAQRSMIPAIHEKRRIPCKKENTLQNPLPGNHTLFYFEDFFFFYGAEVFDFLGFGVR